MRGRVVVLVPPRRNLAQDQQSGYLERLGRQRTSRQTPTGVVSAGHMGHLYCVLLDGTLLCGILSYDQNLSQLRWPDVESGSALILLMEGGSCG